ncbi:MAG TPA: monovalent cation/H(+) antiporter subunit G [Rhodocyclaceae bacterium]|nr:monovalent cation/H(+) antiporter subunit G [Rhodocyclaceae bacterium]
MNGSLLPWIASGLVLSGAVFCLLGAIGVLRLPDCYTRMHSASKAGALGAVLVLAGVAAASSGEVALEAIFALLVVLATAPLAAHAVSRAAHRAGIRPFVGRLGDVLEHGEADGGAHPPRHDQSIASREPRGIAPNVSQGPPGPGD